MSFPKKAVPFLAFALAVILQGCASTNQTDYIVVWGEDGRPRYVPVEDLINGPVDIP